MSILVTKSSMPDFDEYIEEIKVLWETHWLTNNGEKNRKFEKLLKELLNEDFVSLFTNGHLALENLISAFELKGEIITTPFTFVSTTNAIVRCGCKPVFCDINKQNYTIDVNKIEELINENTVAIMPVHVYGNVCNVERIQEIADKYNLKVIYDAAHAFSSKYKGKSISSFGDASMFSFHATKVFNSIEGGLAVVQDQTKLKQLNLQKNFGIVDALNCVEIGGNAKMNEFQAAMGICNLKHLKNEIEKRKKVFNQYQNNLKNVYGIVIPKIQEDVESNYSYYPVIFDNYCFDRDQIWEKLKENDIYSRKYFYPLTCDFECYKDKFFANVPIARDIASKVLTLPLYADLELNDVDRICDIILSKKGNM